jgi:ferric-dicitrate binding protein FerR (iron transport regulator)
MILALCALVGAGATSARADAKIGVASAVKNQVEGRAGALAIGSSVFANERIRTGEASSAQLMFVDKTVVSVGPRAELLLDKYVYNPNRGTGQVVVNAVQGSMRFVTGAQNPTNYAIKTPVATLGIRGTVVDLDIGPEETFIGVLEGTLRIQLLDGTTMTVQAGQSVFISRTGARAGPPYKGDGTPTDPDFPAYVRMDEINEKNAINALGYKPKPGCEYESYECGGYSYFGRRR